MCNQPQLNNRCDFIEESNQIVKWAGATVPIQVPVRSSNKSNSNSNKGNCFFLFLLWLTIGFLTAWVRVSKPQEVPRCWVWGLPAFQRNDAPFFAWKSPSCGWVSHWNAHLLRGFPSQPCLITGGSLWIKMVFETKKGQSFGTESGLVGDKVAWVSMLNPPIWFIVLNLGENFPKGNPLMSHSPRLYICMSENRVLLNLVHNFGSILCFQTHTQRNCVNGDTSYVLVVYPIVSLSPLYRNILAGLLPCLLVKTPYKSPLIADEIPIT